MVWISQLAGAYALALLGGAAPLPSLDSAAAELPTTWAGHQVTFGRREIAFKGEVETRMDSFVLARLRRLDGGVLELTQTACHVRFSKVAGVMVHMDAEALPRTRMLLAPDDEGELRGRSLVAWADEDVDDDGHPGMTVHVRAPVCSGDLYVTNRSTTKASATLSGTELRGRARVQVRQEILGAEGACLGAVAKTTDEQVTGPFAYVPVPEGTTCETLFNQGWPVTASEASPPGPP